MKRHGQKGGPGALSRWSHAMQLAVAVTTISVVLTTSPVHAAPPPGDSGTDERNTTQSPPPDRAADQQRRQKPAPTFTPSEQVGADSAVSFPVDI
jgi:hypothetical protein